LSDEQWALIEPMITAWKQDRVARSATGDPGSCDLKEVVNAIFYQHGCGDHHRRNHQAQHVNGQAALAALYLFAASHPVDSAGTPTAAGTLWGASTTRRVRLPPRLLPHLPAQQVMDGLVGAVVAPPGEAVHHRAARRQVVRKQVLP
jgi:hypothetical protein